MIWSIRNFKTRHRSDGFNNNNNKKKNLIFPKKKKNAFFMPLRKIAKYGERWKYRLCKTRARKRANFRIDTIIILFYNQTDRVETTESRFSVASDRENRRVHSLVRCINVYIRDSTSYRVRKFKETNNNKPSSAETLTRSVPRRNAHLQQLSRGNNTRLNPAFSILPPARPRSARKVSPRSSSVRR